MIKIFSHYTSDIYSMETSVNIFIADQKKLGNAASIISAFGDGAMNTIIVNVEEKDVEPVETVIEPEVEETPVVEETVPDVEPVVEPVVEETTPEEEFEG